MATVVNQAKDTRAAELGLGVSGFLNRMRDRRLDGLQQEMMDLIGSSKDEAEATALFGDPKFQEVVTDNNRLSALVQHLNVSPLGQNTIAGFDKEGNQQLLTYGERETPEEALANAGLSLERSRIFYAVNPNDDFDIPELLGRHTSTEEAKKALPASRQLVKNLIIDQEEAIGFTNMRSATLSSQDQRMNRLLAQERFQFTKEGGHSPFANLQADIDAGILTPEEGEAAWTRMTHIWGQTRPDIKLKMQQKLLPEGANIHAVSEQMVTMMQMVMKDQNILTGAARIPAAVDGIISELSTLAGGLGWTSRPLTEYEPWFEANGLGGRSIAFKNMITSVALGIAAMSGQEGRSLSDKDFDRFLGIAGADISDGSNFITNLNQIMLSQQTQFKRRYAIMTSDPEVGTFGDWEAERGKFPVLFSPVDHKIAAGVDWAKAHPQYKLDMPEHLKGGK